MEVFYDEFRVAPFEQLLRKLEMSSREYWQSGNRYLIKRVMAQPTLIWVVPRITTVPCIDAGDFFCISQGIKEKPCKRNNNYL